MARRDDGNFNLYTGTKLIQGHKKNISRSAFIRLEENKFAVTRLTVKFEHHSPLKMARKSI